MLYLTLRHYEYICAVAQQGSLSAAAEVLHVSQPALSTALARIEAHLGYALFQRRRGAPLSLTARGRDFAKAAQALLDQATQLEAPNEDHSETRRLVLGCFSDLAPLLLAPALRHLRQALPDISITPRVTGFTALTDALLQGEIDLALTYDLGLDAGFSRSELGQRCPQALVPPDHPLARHCGLPLAALADMPLILSQDGLSLQHMMALFKAQGITPHIAHRAASLELLRSLAANGEGVGISYSAPALSHSYDGKPLVLIPISDPIAREPIVLASHGAPLRNSLQARAISSLSQALQDKVSNT